MRRFLFVISLLVSVSLLSSCSLLALSAIRAEPRARAPVELDQDIRPAPRSAIAELVEDVLPSVVNVKVTSVAGRGEGSGVIIDESGVVLTNAHVVEGSVSVQVAFSDDRPSVEGRVVGAIPLRDLAVIEIPGDDLQAVDLGSSENLRLGDDVVAIGYPLGLGGPTVTSGIISGRARSISSSTSGGDQISLEGLLQTDAAINPGNSGGALLDRAGRLVGINTAVAGSAENIGFAIAIDDALPTIEEILNEPAERHAWLGVQTSPLDAAAIGQLGLEEGTEGVVVVNVFAGTPAAEAGIEEGDVITEIDGVAITSPRDLSDAITDRDPGEVVEVALLKEGEPASVEVELDQRPVTLPVR